MRLVDEPTDESVYGPLEDDEVGEVVSTGDPTKEVPYTIRAEDGAATSTI